MPQPTMLHPTIPDPTIPDPIIPDPIIPAPPMPPRSRLMAGRGPSPSGMVFKAIFSGLFGLCCAAVAILGMIPPPAMGAPTKKAATPRIIGGEAAAPGDWPWMVALLEADNTNNYNAHYCGGALIHPQWVLTAGHCAYGEKPGNIEALVGAGDLKSGEGERVPVLRIVMHPDYDDFTLVSDIALLELSRPVSQPTLGLVTDNADLYAGREAMVMGWGATDSLGLSFSSILLEATLPLVSNATCNAAFNAYPYHEYANDILNSMICAGYAAGGTDACVGDSGGPLVIDDNGAWKMAGVVSWGEGCAKPDLYGVYTRVPAFIDFIDPYVGISPLWGQVTAAFAGHPAVGVADAEVILLNTAYSARTDVAGRYSMDVPPGNYTLRIAAPGLVPLAEAITVPAGNEGLEASRQLAIPPAGDFNADGRITLADVVAALRALTGVP